MCMGEVDQTVGFFNRGTTKISGLNTGQMLGKLQLYSLPKITSDSDRNFPSFLLAFEKLSADNLYRFILNLL